MSTMTTECKRRGDAVFSNCRCDPCTERRRKTRKIVDVYGPGAHRVPSDAAWDRIEALLERGWTPAQINQASGIHGRYVEQLICYWRGDGQRRRIGPVRAGILAGLPLVDPPSVRVSALGTTRRLRALARLGWTITAIAFKADLESAEPSLRQIRAGGKFETVSWEMAEAVRMAYREMMTTSAPRSAGASRVRRMAVAKGWPSPIDFHDPDTDPPIEGWEDDIPRMI